MNIRTVLVDDEPLALRRLAMTLDDMQEVEVVGTARDGVSAARVIAENAPDLVVLDIQMPGRSGLNLAAALPSEQRPEVIFVTAFERYAADAFDVEATDYLLKPVRPERLRQAIERVRRLLILKRNQARLLIEAKVAETGRAAVADEASGAFPNALWVPTRDGEIRVGARSVAWIEAAADYVILHTPLRSHMVRATISSMEKVFDPALVRRVHRSAMANLAMVEEVRRPGRGAMVLVLRDGVTIPVGPNHTEAVASALKIR